MSEMTKDDIEGWRAQFLVAFQGIYRAEIDALCDLALKSLDQGAQEAVAWIVRDENGLHATLERPRSRDDSIHEVQSLYPAPTAELIEALREARNYVLPYSIGESTVTIEATKPLLSRIDALLARK